MAKRYCIKGKWFDSLVELRKYAYTHVKLYSDVLYRPENDGYPVIGRIINMDGQILWETYANSVFSNYGHNVWILNKDGTLGKDLGNIRIHMHYKS